MREKEDAIIALTSQVTRELCKLRLEGVHKAELSCVNWWDV